MTDDPSELITNGHARAAAKDYEAAADLGLQGLSLRLSGHLNPVEIEAICYWHAHAGRVGTLMKDLFPVFRMISLNENDPAERAARGQTAYNLGQEILESGALHDALRFFHLADEINPTHETTHAVGLFENLRGMIADATRRGRTIAADRAIPMRYVVSCVVWGEEYIDNFMNYLVRTLIAEGNLTAFDSDDVVVAIMTTEAGEARMRAHPMFGPLNECARVEFFLFPEWLTQAGEHVDPSFSFYQLYGALDHVAIFFAKALGSGIFFLPVDALLAENTLHTFAAYLETEHDAVGGSHFTTNRETFLPAIDAIIPDAPAFAIPASQLIALAYEHLHQHSSSAIIHDGNADFAEWPRELFWPSPEGLHTRAIFVHPLGVSAAGIARDIPLNYKWVDYKFADNLFTEPGDFARFKVIENASTAFIADCTTSRRRYHSTDKPFDPRLFAERNLHATPIHRWFLDQPQFLPLSCELTTERDLEADVVHIKCQLQELAPQ